jgi:hypothetical protein
VLIMAIMGSSNTKINFSLSERDTKMREKISEKNKFPNFDLFEEYRKIEYLLSEAHTIGTYNQFRKRMTPRFTMEEYINELCFTSWNLRGTFISIEEMRAGLGIEKARFDKKTINTDLVLDFIQYAVNCNFRVAETIKNSTVAYLADANHFSVLLDNMNAILNHFGAHFSLDEKTLEVFIIYDDDLSTIVSDEHPEIQISLAEYKKIDNHRDLKRKGEILCTLFKRLEADEKKFKGTTYEKLCSDTTFLFNKTGIRHWVEKDKIASKTFLEMPPEELELWYDRTYTMFLSCMIISQYLDTKKEIDVIKAVLISENNN